MFKGQKEIMSKEVKQSVKQVSLRISLATWK